MIVKVIGAGLAGCEAAWALANQGIEVELYEMKPLKKSPAHQYDYFAELVCSNSLRSDELTNAVGLLKAEMRLLDSLTMKAASICKIPAGSALAVDRDGFGEYITNTLKSHPLIKVINQEVTSLNPDEYTIVAAGPLASEPLALAIKELLGEDYLSFYDAVAPIVSFQSIDLTKAYFKSRYDKGDKEAYLNCPLTKAEFLNFYDILINSKLAKTHEFEKETFFEGCMPIEEMARRGIDTLLFGPMKPVGLEVDGKRPYAVIQLRQDDAAKSLYNLVGFQTHLTFPEQKRLLNSVPALKDVEIVRYGVMHRNTYLNSPKILNHFYQVKKYPKLFFAGQISGVEGYVESAASGLIAGYNLASLLKTGHFKKMGDQTMIQSMANYIANEAISKLVPMNANFGIFNCEFSGKKKDKRDYYASVALAQVKEYLDA